MRWAHKKNTAHGNLPDTPLMAAIQHELAHNCCVPRKACGSVWFRIMLKILSASLESAACVVLPEIRERIGNVKVV